MAKPIVGGRLNYFFAAEPNETFVQGGRFRYQLHHAPTSLVLLKGKCTPKVWASVEPGAQASFRQTTTGQGKLTYAFGGTNAAANNLLANGKRLSNGPADQERVSSLLGSAPRQRRCWPSRGCCKQNDCLAQAGTRRPSDGEKLYQQARERLTLAH